MASSACASATCWRSCTSGRCRPSCANITSSCSRARCCRISRTCGTTATRTAGGRSACARNARSPPPPPSPPRPERSAIMAAPEVRRLKLWQGRVETEVEISGNGPPLVYLHGPWGLAPDRAFVARLAEVNRVYAPKHPGTSRGDPEAVHALDSWLDLVVYYGELLDRLELHSFALAGHSFGALMAAEIAAAAPKAVRRLVLIDPVGLWRDDLPVRNWMVLSEAERAPSLFADPQGEAAKRFFGTPDDPAERVDVLAQSLWSQACTGKFVWPVPDRGLKGAAHRIAAPTLIVWGDADRIIAPAYAQEFASRIAGARVALIDRAGHLPQLEQPDAVAKAVLGFLGGG